MGQSNLHWSDEKTDGIKSLQ